MTLPLIRGAALLAVVALVATTNAQPPLPPPRPVVDTPDAVPDASEQPEPGVKVAEKGPIHEAFAQPGADTRGKGLTAPKAPPKPIPELPPDTKPDGENVRWVPGYWHWDAEQGDFMWISGFWRNVPPGRTWQAGEWIEKNGSWMYTPGFWRPTGMNNWRVDLPEPPKSVESGPSTPSDNPDAVWIPGAWEYRNEQFVWRPGYWAYPNENQVWQPGQYLATGSGYSYCPGYWDYPLEDRGLLNAPVYFTEPLWQTPGWAFRPRFAFGLGLGWGGWGTGSFFNSLWIGPGFNNFCYGNYFNPWFNGGWGGFGAPFWGPAFGFGFGFGNCFGFGGGFFPWWGTCRGFCNPLWNHYCHLNKGNPNWANQVRAAGVARAVGATPRQAIVAANNSGKNPLGISPTGGVAGAKGGVGGAAKTAARAAANAAAPKPLIQPASQAARSLKTGRGGENASASPRAPRIGGNSGVATARPGGSGAGSVTNAGGRSPQGQPTHAGALQITPGGGRASGPIAGGNLPTPKVAGGAQPLGPTVRYGNAAGDRSGNLPIRPDGSAAGRSTPVIRSGTLPGNSSSGQPVLGGGNSGSRAISPQLRPSAPSPSQFRPSAPSFQPRSSGPAMRPSGGSMGGGRSIGVSPGGGRPIGGGGARPGGGGGGRGGGKR